jgi:multidrug efflux pump subunit AcrB
VDDADARRVDQFDLVIRLHRRPVEGAKEISTPVIFAVLTTIAAFFPMLGVPGVMGKIMRVIPLVVISCLIFSLLESLLVLPAHLRHMRAASRAERNGLWGRFQSKFADGLMWFVRRVYSPLLDLGLRHRYATVALAAATITWRSL